MYVFGGDVGFERESTTSVTVFKYDSTQDTWSRVAPMPAARRAFSACAIGSDIFVFGGIENSTTQATVFKLDTVANEWSTLAPLPHATDWTCACALGSLVYIVGAGGGRETLRFDSVTETWTSLKSTEKLRMGSKAFVLNGSLYVTGGLGGGPSVECYDEATNTWLAMTDMLESRLHFGAVTIRDARPTDDEDLFDSLIAKASRRLL
jgi:N-acetylneuraminic acid mutarotase